LKIEQHIRPTVHLTTFLQRIRLQKTRVSYYLPQSSRLLNLSETKAPDARTREHSCGITHISCSFMYIDCAIMHQVLFWLSTL